MALRKSRDGSWIVDVSNGINPISLKQRRIVRKGFKTKKEALEAELVSQLDLLIKDEARIIAAIMQMPDMHFRTILLDHYINGKGWEQIAAQFEVARRTVCKKWLEPALEEFSQNYEKDGEPKC